MDTKLIVTASPHVHAPESTRTLMGNVVISLLPCVVASTIIFGFRALLLTAVTVAACIGFEYGYCKLLKKKNPVGDLSAVVTGIILAMNFPVSLPLWMGVVGAFIAIVLIKQLFGGLGMNFANPALVGRIALFSGFSAAMTNWTYPAAAVDQLSKATPLQVPVPDALNFMDLFLGVHGGVMGETCALAILIGFAYLVFTKTISPAIPVTYLATVAVMSLLCGQNVMVQLLSGGLLFGGNSVGLYLPYRFSERLAHGIHHLTFLNLDVDAVSDKLRHPGINHLQQSLDSLVGYIRAVGRSGCRQWLLNRRFLWCGGVSGAGQFIVGSDLVFAIIHFFFNEIVGIYSEGSFDAAKKSHLSSFSIIFHYCPLKNGRG